MDDRPAHRVLVNVGCANQLMQEALVALVQCDKNAVSLDPIAGDLRQKLMFTRAVLDEFEARMRAPETVDP